MNNLVCGFVCVMLILIIGLSAGLADPSSVGLNKESTSTAISVMAGLSLVGVLSCKMMPAAQ